jgi:hypothetical protein
VRIRAEGVPEDRSDAGASLRPRWIRWPLVLIVLLLLVGTALLGVQIWQVVVPGVANAPEPRAQGFVASTPSPQPTPTSTSPELGDLLETLYIDIHPQELAELEAKRQEALERWVLLTDADDFVPAELRFRGETLPARLRLKGDWADHVAHDKWSFRIETRSDHYLLGMETFSVQDPSMRTYLDEYLYLEALRAEGVLGVRYDFLHVVLNGQYMGIYALEEAFAKEILEFQKRREGLIIRYDEDLLWTARFHYDEQTIPPSLEEFYVIDEFSSGRVDRSPTLSAQRDTAVGLLRGFLNGDLPAPEVFDVETMGKFLAAVDLWSAPHGLIWHNLRYYYNPVTARLEPVAFDNDPFSPELDFELVGLNAEDFNHDPYLQAAYAQALWEMGQPGYVDELEARLGADYARLRAALESEFDAEVLRAPWDLLRRRQELSRQRLAPIQTTYAYRVRPTDVRAASLPSDTLMLEVGNLLDLPVEIVEIRLDGETHPAHTSWVDTASLPHIVPPLPADSEALVLRALPPDAAALPYVRLTLPLTATPETEIELHARVWGLTDTIAQPVQPSYALPLTEGPRPVAPPLDEALRQHPYVQRADEPGWLTIPPGTWDISGTLVLPDGYGLHLGPGTTLRFGAEDFLLASGPLHFQGTAEASVQLQPQNGEVWLGVIVLDADAPSFWEHVTIEKTDAIMRDGWMFTGAVTFHRSPVRISHGRFLGTRAEDALNIIRADFEMVDTEFVDTASDAFDGDFTVGVIERCVFRDVAADGIDISGSDLTVRDVRFYNLGDKALSVGEASRMVAENIYVETADFALASKDGSHLEASNVTARNIDIAALAAFTKKPAYGSATMAVERMNFGDIPSDRYTLVQTGSYIDLDGQRIWGTQVDVDALYEKWQD